jgi:hypothetical protein
MRSVKIRLPDELAAGVEAAALTADDVPAGMTLPALVRYLLAGFAGWPRDAALAIARPRAASGKD